MTAVHTTVAPGSVAGKGQKGKGPTEFLIKETRKAVMCTADVDADEDWVPPL